MRLQTKDLITDTDLMSFKRFSSYISNKKHLHYVYFLVDPFSFQIKYVGRGVNNRALKHWSTYDSHNARKQSWIDKLKTLKSPYKIVVWELYESKDLCDLQEENFINMFGRKGIDNKGTLLNIAKGGKGGLTISKAPYIFRLKDYCEENDLVILSKYNRSDELMWFRCLKHNHKFERTPNRVLRADYTCPLCAEDGKSAKMSSNKREFISKALLVHNGNYTYNYVVYKNSRTKVDIYCKRCKDMFEQTPSKHLQGRGCPNMCYTKRVKEVVKS